MEFINRPNQTLVAKQHAVALLGNLNFSQIQDQTVFTFLLEFQIKQLKSFIEFCIKDPKSLKKRILKEKFRGKKAKLKNAKVSASTLLKEKIELESTLLNNFM